MNKRAVGTFSLGVASLIMLLLSKIIVSITLMATALALIGAFVGIWNLCSLFFKSQILNTKEKLYLYGGILASLLSFGFGRYGFMLFFWLPGVVIGIFFLQLLTLVFFKSSSVMMPFFKDKVTKMEEELNEKKSNPPLNP